MSWTVLNWYLIGCLIAIYVWLILRYWLRDFTPGFISDKLLNTEWYVI